MPQLETVDETVAQLPPAIREYIVDAPHCQFLAHPFIQTPLMTGALTASQIIEAVSTQKELFQKHCDDGNFDDALNFVVKGYRTEYLYNLIDQHGVEVLYPAIGPVWIDVENINECFNLWDDIWCQVVDGTGDPDSIMGADDRRAFDDLPELITIYRGYQNDGGECSWSWTLDRKMAEWFARRGNGTAHVATLTIPKHASLAFFGGRSESEIIIHPDQVNDRASIEVLEPITDVE